MGIIDVTLGATQTSTTISAFLLGWIVVQSYGYLKNYPCDPRGVKCLVSLLLVLEFGQQVSMMDLAYTTTIKHWGDESSLLHLPASFPIMTFLNIVTVPAIDFFYFWRMSKLLNTMWPSLVGVITSCLRCAGWTLFGVEGVKLGYSSPSLVDNWSWLIITLLLFGVLINLFIGMVMVFFLHRNRNTPFMRTRDSLDRLVLWIISTSLITTLPTTASFVLFFTMKHNFIWMSILPCATKVYVICLLSSLNNRPRSSELGSTLLEATTGQDIPLQSQNMPIVVNISTEHTTVRGSSTENFSHGKLEIDV